MAQEETTMTVVDIAVGFFVSFARGIAGIVNQFGKPVADMLHSFFSFIPNDALVGSGTLILIIGYLVHGMVNSTLGKAAVVFILSSVFFIVATNPQTSTVLTNALNNTLNKTGG